MTYKTKFERGTVKYQVKFIGKRFLIAGTSLHPWGLIEGQDYLVYKMKVSGRIVVQGKYEQDFTGMIQNKSIEFSSDFCKDKFKYMTN